MATEQSFARMLRINAYRWMRWDAVNELPHGSCEDPHVNPHIYDHNCGWVRHNNQSKEDSSMKDI